MIELVRVGVPPAEGASPSLSCGWPWAMVVEDADLLLRAEETRLIAVEDSAAEGRLPCFSFETTRRSPICRPRDMSEGFLMVPLLQLLPPLVLLLRVGVFSRLALSLPSITLALGGGCSIHNVSVLFLGWVLTTGGWRSLISGFLA